MQIETKEHKELNGNLEGIPFKVIFDPEGSATVEDPIGDFLTAANYGVKKSKKKATDKSAADKGAEKGSGDASGKPEVENVGKVTVPPGMPEEVPSTTPAAPEGGGK
jgi:hypothetical protein